MVAVQIWKYLGETEYILKPSFTRSHSFPKPHRNRHTCNTLKSYRLLSFYSAQLHSDLAPRLLLNPAWRSDNINSKVGVQGVLQADGEAAQFTF